MKIDEDDAVMSDDGDDKEEDKETKMTKHVWKDVSLHPSAVINFETDVARDIFFSCFYDEEDKTKKIFVTDVKNLSYSLKNFGEERVVSSAEDAARNKICIILPTRSQQKGVNDFTNHEPQTIINVCIESEERRTQAIGRIGRPAPNMIMGGTRPREVNIVNLDFKWRIELKNLMEGVIDGVEESVDDKKSKEDKEDTPVDEGGKQEGRATRSSKKKAEDEEVVSKKKKTELEKMIEKFDENATEFMKDKKEEIVRIATLLESSRIVDTRTTKEKLGCKFMKVATKSFGDLKKCTEQYAQTVLEYSSKIEDEDDGEDEGEEEGDDALSKLIDDVGAGPSGVQKEEEVLYVNEDSEFPDLPPLVSSNAETHEMAQA